MSIRIRESGGVLIALCAAETDAEPGDRYLDDAEHYALAAKFAHDWHGQTLDWECPEEWAEMAKHKKRDAIAELNNWLDALADTHPQGGDVKQAPFMSGAVGSEADETPNTLSNPSPNPSRGEQQ